MYVKNNLFLRPAIILGTCKLPCLVCYFRVILKCEKDSFSRKGLLFLRKGLTLSVIGVKYGDNLTISILKMLLMVQSIKITLTCFLFIVTYPGYMIYRWS